MLALPPSAISSQRTESRNKKADFEETEKESLITGSVVKDGKESCEETSSSRFCQAIISKHFNIGDRSYYWIIFCIILTILLIFLSIKSPRTSPADSAAAPTRSSRLPFGYVQSSSPSQIEKYEPHVLDKYDLEPNWKEIVDWELLHFDPRNHFCSWYTVVNQKCFVPDIRSRSNPVKFMWRSFMSMLLEEYEVPDVRFHIHGGDYTNGYGACLASSTRTWDPSPAITNFLAIQQVGSGYFKVTKNSNPFKNWEEKRTVIAWRGTVRGQHPPKGHQNFTDAEIRKWMDEHNFRLKAVDLARDVPFLDFQLSGKKPGNKKWVFWKDGHKGQELYPFNRIKSSEYYGSYRYHAVLCGIGAAWRFTTHLKYGNLVLLQKCDFEEWFLKYMIPWKHYILIDEDLSNLIQIAKWVQNHPEESKKIAMAGYKFFVKYLSAEPTKQFVVQYLKSIAKMKITWVDHATGVGAGTDVQTANFRSIVPNPDVIFNKYFYMPKTEASKKRKKDLAAAKRWIDECARDVLYQQLYLVPVYKWVLKHRDAPKKCGVDMGFELINDVIDTHCELVGCSS